MLIDTEVLLLGQISAAADAALVVVRSGLSLMLVLLSRYSMTQLFKSDCEQLMHTYMHDSSSRT